MHFSRVFLNRLQNEPRAAETVVVIDVLRSFTTAAVALDQGATAIYPVESLAEAQIRLAAHPRAVTIGAIAGGDPAPGFDFGNSPSRLISADLAGRPAILSTAAGVRGLLRFRHARRLFAATLPCAKATARAIRRSGTRRVCFVITGEWVDRDGDEDIACADYIEALLDHREVSSEAAAARVRASDFGRRFLSGNWPNLPRADLDIASQVDVFDFAMPVSQRDGQLVIHRLG